MSTSIINAHQYDISILDKKQSCTQIIAIFDISNFWKASYKQLQEAGMDVNTSHYNNTEKK